MKVYAIPVECYDCHKAYDALSYIHFAAFYDDVSFPYILPLRFFNNYQHSTIALLSGTLSYSKMKTIIVKYVEEKFL